VVILAKKRSVPQLIAGMKISYSKAMNTARNNYNKSKKAAETWVKAMKKKKLLIVSFFVLAIAFSSVFAILYKPNPKPGNDNHTTDPNGDHGTNPGDATNKITQIQYDTALKTLVVDQNNDPSAKTSSLERYDAIDFAKRFFRPVYDTKLTLYMASSPVKPTMMPSLRISKNPIAVNGKLSSYQKTAFIDSSLSTVRWFSLIKDATIKPAKYVWQVGAAPFQGSGGNQINPAGLLSSGNIAAGANEFSIDFAKAITATTLATRLKVSPTILRRILLLPTSTIGSSPVQKTYYIRVIPVDAAGKVIGDGGTGSPIIYGQAYTKTISSRLISFKFNLDSPGFKGEATFNGEFPNVFLAGDKRFIDSTSGTMVYCFLPSGYAADTTSLILQVAKGDFTSSSWETTAGLVYQIRLNAGETAFDKLDKFNSIKVDFSKFAPADSTLKEKEAIDYFVRVVALKPGSQLGTVNATYSKTVTVQYGRPQADAIKIYANTKIDAKLPQVISVAYTPIEWEKSNWVYRYVVIRQPLENEIFLGFGSNKPYAPYTVGTKLDFTPQPEDKSWWEEAVDAVSSFFSDVVGFVGDLTNWVASTYNNLKTGLVKFVAQNLPLVPDSLRDGLQSALEGLVDYGLASIGIPPTLPNFDQLSEMGTDYLATCAMDAAGIPGSDYIADGLTDLGKGVVNQMKTSTNSGGPNPFNWNFIKADPDFMYKPAYVLITLHNPYNVETPQGYINGSNEFVIDTTKAMDASTQYLYAAFGGNVYYHTFKPVDGQIIPALAPDQTLVIPVFLEEIVGDSFWTNGPKIDKGQFKMIYYNLGKFNFNFSLNYALPPAGETAKAQGLPGDAIYSYTSTGTAISFKTEPAVAYSK
jgi:hypothetical protein